MSQYLSAERVQTASGKQYHIGCGPGDLASYILLCGDPARVDKVAKLLKNVKPAIKHREYVSITGTWQGIPVSVMATGMGPDNTEIAVVEIAQIVESPTLIRIGSSGGLKKEAAIGDLAISTGAVRLENTTDFFVCDGYPAVAHHEVLLALIEAADQSNFSYHVGLTATAPGFYGAQGRTVPKFAPKDPELPKKLDSMNVINLEMEASVLFVLGNLAGLRTGAVCALYNNRHLNRFIDEATMKKAEAECIETGLKAIEILSRMDKIRGKKKHWTPSMGI
ncbi:MAG: nucleoside phosphorylase [Deltaproteobacteria bacterium]|nr:nucleoside phosphorylase [Deltaproteobacteria bacterium]